MYKVCSNLFMFDRYFDNRGVYCADGDLVLCLASVHNHFNVSVCERKSNILIDLDTSEPCQYVGCSVFIKINSYTAEEYKKLREIYKGIKYFGSSVQNLTDYLYSLEDSYMKDNQRTNTRGFKTRDILGRELKPGSFVLYSGEKIVSTVGNQWSYGIVISDTELFTEHLTTVAVKHVVLIEPEYYTDREDKLYKDLVRLYKQKAITSAMVQANGKYKIGDIYRLDEVVYLYIGRCRLVYDAPSESNIVIDYTHDENKEYWINLGNLSVASINKLLSNDRIYLNSVMQRFFKDCCIEKKRYYITSNLYAMYKSVTKFNMFVDVLPPGTVYVGNMQMYIYFENEHSKNELWNFKMRLELLGVNGS